MISVCIPNYNYEKYLGLTIQSVLNQSVDGFEICIADNKSTDRSVEIIQNFQLRHRDKIRYVVNSLNVGFAGNLDKVASLAKGDHIIMISSDDVVLQNAFAAYHQVIDFFKPGSKVIISSCIDTIDSGGKKIATQRAKDFRFGFWSDEHKDTALTQLLGVNVFRMKPFELLKKCLVKQVNPFNFCATCFPKECYDSVGGYGAGRLINPDKWFHWKLLSVADEVILIDHPFFQYRWHDQNQSAQQAGTGYLKYLVDEYRNTMEILPDMLSKASLNKNQLVKAFVKYDIFRHGIGEFVKGRWLKSLRVLLFGMAAYPGKTITNVLFIPYFIILLSGPVGSFFASIFFKRQSK